MFTFQVDSDLALVLVHERYAERYEMLAKENYEYLSQWLAWPPHCRSAQNFRNFIKGALKDYAEGKSMTCGILFHDELVGNVSFNDIDQDLKTVQVGYWIGQSYQGNGIITRVCQALINMAFTEMGMKKVQISAAVDNHPSRAVCERLGMTLEGVISRAENLNGRIVDHAVYGLLKSE